MVRTDRFVKAVNSRLRGWADWRCSEHVIIFESDDWGLRRTACADFLAQFGKPSDWAGEDSETIQDLEMLYEVLSSHRDHLGRAASFVANFVVGNPDFRAITRNGYEKYFEIPITEEAALRPKWGEGMKRRVFLPQYHARYHQSVGAWLRDLRANEPGARELCSREFHGGLGLIKGRLWRYHSEYVDWTAGKQLEPSELDQMLAGSLAIFREVFGMRPLSVAAPHYIFSSRVARAWRRSGIRYGQAAGYHLLRKSDGGRRILSHAFGEVIPNGLICLARRVKFEPRPQRPDQGVASALRAIQYCFEKRIPAIIDTHRINYTGAHRKDGLAALNELLTAVRPYRARFITTVELGEAIEGDGRYHDVWTGEEARLTPMDSSFRRVLRRGWSAYHDRVAGGA